MIVLDELNKYLKPIGETTQSILDNSIKTKGAYETWVSLQHDLDCTRETPDKRFRIVQTIDYTYGVYLSEALYLIKEHLHDSHEAYVRLLDIHRNNIEFEKSIPPIVYTKEKAKKEPKKREPRVTKVRHANRSAKLEQLKLTFKPIHL